MRIPSFPTDLGWCVYGLGTDLLGEPFVQGFGQSPRAFDGTWRHDHVTLHYGDFHNWNAPHYRVVSAPHLGDTALRELHSGLGRAGFVFGMSGTGHISGAPVSPERITLQLDSAPTEAEVWRGQAVEVAWIETVDTWITVLASKVSLAGVHLNQIPDVNPLLEARNRKLGLPGR